MQKGPCEKVQAKAKSCSTPHPVWIQGDYLTKSRELLEDGAVRPVSHYIDKGGCPGVNVYEVSIGTLCMDTGAADRQKRRIFENDILLYETGQEIGYFIIQDADTAVDIINGEILGVADLQAEDIKVIGSQIDFPDFVDGIRYCVETGREVPYLPALDVMGTGYPFFKMTCLKCGHVMLSCAYMARHKGCGGYLAADYTTRLDRRGEQK